MNKIVEKIIVITLILGQMLSPALAGFHGIADADEGPSSARISMRQLNSFSSVIVVINSNISQQARQLVELACLCSNLVASKDEPMPLPSGKKSRNTSCDPCYTVSLQGAQLVKYERTIFSSPWQKLANSALFLVTLLAGLFVFLSVSIYRRKIAAWFYCLPRGSIDDAFIIINYKINKPPLAQGQRGFFISSNQCFY